MWKIKFDVWVCGWCVGVGVDEQVMLAARQGRSHTRRSYRCLALASASARRWRIKFLRGHLTRWWRRPHAGWFQECTLFQKAVSFPAQSPFSRRVCHPLDICRPVISAFLCVKGGWRDKRELSAVKWLWRVALWCFRWCVPLQLDRLHESIDERNPCAMYVDTKEEEIKDRLQTRSVFWKTIDTSWGCTGYWLWTWAHLTLNMGSFEHCLPSQNSLSADLLARWGLSCKQGLTTDVKLRLYGPSVSL